MAIQPCHYCHRPISSSEYYAHDVVCNGPKCQEQKRSADQLMQKALDAVEHVWTVERYAGCVKAAHAQATHALKTGDMDAHEEWGRRFHRFADACMKQFGVDLRAKYL